jgi:protein involved in polysaccharide export with SLBB domain
MRKPSVICTLLVVFFITIAGMATANAAGRRVAALDTIQIRILNQPEFDTQVRVAPDGTISFPYVGRFRAAGLTEDEIAARIRNALVSAGLVK